MLYCFVAVFVLVFYAFSLLICTFRGGEGFLLSDLFSCSFLTLSVLSRDVFLASGLPDSFPKYYDLDRSEVVYTRFLLVVTSHGTLGTPRETVMHAWFRVQTWVFIRRDLRDGRVTDQGSARVRN